eukprot:m.244783 g.244783  ORF g.244783 m.244783 type:complete len:118 (+) comp19477_c0_seq6:1636-1989(+)
MQVSIASRGCEKLSMRDVYEEEEEEEKNSFRKKSIPHTTYYIPVSPTATTTSRLASAKSRRDSIVDSLHFNASCGWTPTVHVNRREPVSSSDFLHICTACADTLTDVPVMMISPTPA